MGRFTTLCPVGYPNPSFRNRQGVESSHEGRRAKFYERYRKEAEDYDEEFMKKYEEDLDTTLIFVCCVHRPKRHMLINHSRNRPVCSPL